MEPSAHRCPICMGSRNVIYQGGVPVSAGASSGVQCSSCGGTGIVWWTKADSKHPSIPGNVERK